MELHFQFEIDGKTITPKRISKAFNVSENAARKIKQEFWADMARSASFIIRSMKFKENAELTLDLKGENKPPLYETGDLFEAITVKQINQHSAKIYVPTTHKNYQIYKAIHNGTRIKVTEKMRSMFEMLAMASNGVISPTKLTGRAKELWKKKQKGWKSLDQNTKYIVIPPRPFIRKLFNSEEFRLAFKAGMKKLMRRYIQQVEKGI